MGPDIPTKDKVGLAIFYTCTQEGGLALTARWRNHPCLGMGFNDHEREDRQVRKLVN